MRSVFPSLGEAPLSWNRALALGVVAFGCAVAGASVAISSTLAQFGLMALLVGAGVFFVLRAFLRPHDASIEAGSASVWEKVGPPVRGGFAIARAFFYLGLVSVGQLSFRPAAGFTLSDWLFLVSLGAVFVEMAVRRRRTDIELPPLLMAGITIFALAGIFSSMTAVSPLQSLVAVVKFVYVTVVWYWLATVLLIEPRHLAMALTLYVTSAAINGLAAIAQFGLGTRIPYTTYDWGRFGGFTDHVNDLGGLSGIAMVPALVVALHFGRGSRRLVAVLPVLLVGAGLLLSGSVGGTSAALAGLCTWVIMAGLRPKLLLALGILGVVAAVVLAVQPSTGGRTPFERFSTVTKRSDSEDSTLWSRIRTYESAWSEITNSPFVGVGLDEESHLTETGYQVHNVLLSAWYEAGVFGMIGLAVMIVAGVTASRGVISRARDSSDWILATAMVPAWFAFMTFSLSAPVLYKRIDWITLAFLVVLSAQQMRVARRRPVVSDESSRGIARSVRQINSSSQTMAGI